MRSCHIVSGLVLALLAGTASAQASSDPAILTLVQSFNDARNRFDAKALDGLLAPDYVEVSPRGEIDRRPAVLGFYTPDKATPVPPMRFHTDDVRHHGDSAIVIGSIDYTLPDPSGGTVTRSVRVTYVEQRIGQTWKMTSVQYTGVMPPKPAS